jgi:hypothetical protein
MADTRSIRADYAAVSCDVCGRTLLRGEHPDAFLAGGVRRQVCDLCIPRAQHEGWIREAGMDELGTGAIRQEGRRSLLERFRGHRGRTREAAAQAAAAHESREAQEPQEAQGAPESQPARRRREEEADGGSSRVEKRSMPRPARQVRAVPTNAELKRQRAVDLFNASQFPRTVGGVARSLGPPDVCVRPLADRPSVVTITVMWELSWYRFEADLSDEAGGVRRDAQGTELEELDPAETTANALADERGALRLTSSG